MIEAVALAKKNRKSQHREIVLVVVGGFKFDGYEKLAKKLDIEKSIIFMVKPGKFRHL